MARSKCFRSAHVVNRNRARVQWKKNGQPMANEIERPIPMPRMPTGISFLLIFAVWYLMMMFIIICLTVAPKKKKTKKTKKKPENKTAKTRRRFLGKKPLTNWPEIKSATFAPKTHLSNSKLPIKKKLKYFVCFWISHITKTNWPTKWPTPTQKCSTQKKCLPPTGNRFLTPKTNLTSTAGAKTKGETLSTTRTFQCMTRWKKFRDARAPLFTTRCPTGKLSQKKVSPSMPTEDFSATGKIHSRSVAFSTPTPTPRHTQLRYLWQADLGGKRRQAASTGNLDKKIKTKKKNKKHNREEEAAFFG